MIARLFAYLRRYVTGKAFACSHHGRKRRIERTLRLQGVSRSRSTSMAALL